MTLYDNKLYMEDVRKVSSISLPWEKLYNRSILLSGATGLIGSMFIDVIMEKNHISNLNCTIYALGRSKEKIEARFDRHIGDSHFIFLPNDVRFPLTREDIETVDYVFHLASNTHPMLYATDPIGTITTNIIGVQNLLDFAVEHNVVRFVFASSNEIYGENRGDVEFFDEEYCGYINCNSLRAAYPESKRCGEALCQAYKTQKGLDIVVARLTRSYGPTMDMSNTRALSQLIKNGINGEDIVLKSDGSQYYSYTYMADAVSGLLQIMLKGKNGEAYNIAAENGDITLKDLASIIAGMEGKKVVFEKPNVVEAAGFSKVTKARLDGSKLKCLGWIPQYDIQTGIERTIKILKDLQR